MMAASKCFMADVPHIRHGSHQWNKSQVMNDVYSLCQSCIFCYHLSFLLPPMHNYFVYLSLHKDVAVNDAELCF